ncbi:MAG: hypothetical protein KatS3mg110_3097 [Pirellulaceae bacterium]|nr:MAG: hypothetical protein KatS3mg110_3097 [Pirellulaceae bacterium]
MFQAGRRRRWRVRTIADRRLSLPVPRVLVGRAGNGQVSSWHCALLWAPATVFLAAACLSLAVQSQESDTRSAPTAESSSNDALLEAYLKRLGVTRLEIAYWEERLESAGASRKVTIARRLADLYVGRLIESAVSDDDYQQWMKRLERLLDEIPEARTPAVELVLLEAEYRRTEAIIGQWLSQPAQEAARTEAQKILPLLVGRLQEKRQELERLADEAVRRWEAADSDPQTERQMIEAQTLAARATYYTAWASLYAALLQEPINRPLLEQATSLFTKLLGLENEKDLAGLDPTLLGLESPWRARAACGWMMCRAALGDRQSAERAWQWIRQAAVGAVREQADYWFTQALVWAGWWKELASWAEERLIAPSADTLQGKTAFFVGLVHAAHFPKSPPPADIQKRLVAVGVKGLIHLRQWPALKHLAALYDLELPMDAGFPVAWWQAQQRRAEADKTARAEDYRAAADAYRRALALAGRDDDPRAVAQCRHELAWCLYRAEDYTEAAKVYLEAAEALRRAGDDQAVHAAWMAAVSIEKGFPDPRAGEQLQQVAAWLRREYPQHELTQRVEFLVEKQYTQQLPLEEQIQRLERMAATDPNYPIACWEAAGLRYRQWQQAPAEQKRELGRAFVARLQSVLPSIEGRLSSEQRFGLYMMLVKVAAQSDQQQAAQDALARLERFWSQWSGDQRAELRYQQLQLARASKNQAEVAKLGRWFLEQGRASRFEAAALSVAANALDPAATEEHKRLLYDIYGRLVELWGNDPARWTTDRNAHAAAARRAALAWELGFEDEAGRWYDALLEAYPRERAYLRAAGLLAFQKKQWERSLQCWRTLLAGTPVGSDAWYEAKYYQLRCLLEIDRTAARQVWQEFNIVAPTGGTAAWQEKFRQLQQQFAAP